MQDWVTRMTRGTDLRGGIEDYQKVHHIKAGIITAAVGCVSVASLRLADGHTKRRFEQPYEIVSLSGTLSCDGSHLHISLADTEGKVIGGHLEYGTIVNTTCELAIRQLDDEYDFSRVDDPQTGYDELKVSRHD